MRRCFASVVIMETGMKTIAGSCFLLTRVTIMKMTVTSEGEEVGRLTHCRWEYKWCSYFGKEASLQKLRCIPLEADGLTPRSILRGR